MTHHAKRALIDWFSALFPGSRVTTGTAGCFGSAAATATLMAPGDEDLSNHALATAATFASGLQQAFRSDVTKALHAGHAGWVGVTAGVGAGSGITGVTIQRAALSHAIWIR